MFSRQIGLLLGCSVVFTAAAARAQSDAPASAEAADPGAPVITVTGTAPERRSTTTTGSRIGRRDVPAPFPTVATSTGVAGLTPGSGMDPFAGGTRTITETACRSDDRRISAEAACRLLPIQRLLASGSFEEARSALDRLASADAATDEERYIAATLQYRMAVATGEPLDREDALRAMLATAAMPAADRPAALRSLISIAIARGDDAGTEALLEQLLLLAPEDTRNLANLASLRARAGRQAEAASLIGRAIDIARRRGEPVPSEWLGFASSEPPAR
jgi:hypothetical protein